MRVHVQKPGGGPQPAQSEPAALVHTPPRAAVPAAGTAFRHDFSAVPPYGARPAPSSPLPGVLRSSLEGYLGAPLDRVRLHDGPASQAAAASLGASAFTVGQDIHLGADALGARGPARTALLAHEVVHTLQQGPAVPRARLAVGARDDTYERQADQLAAGFSRFSRNPGDSVALALRDSMRIRPLSGDAPVIQRGRVPTHFGEFEDYKYEDLTNAAGTKVGVEMYLKFHPTANARADLIGLTQAAEGIENGTQITSGMYGQRSATSGPGTGVFIDRLEGYPNPLYKTEKTPRAGGDASKLTDYDTTAIRTLTAKQQTAVAAGTGITGMRYTGGAQQGYRKVVAGNYVTQSAELYDAPVLMGAGANSEQVFESTALAISGPQAGTYYGSVEWGWRKDAAGAFTRLPLRAISQGVPSASFLTAATIWNGTRASLAYTTSVATSLLDATGTAVSAIPVRTLLTPTGGEATGAGGVRYVEVTHGGVTGFVRASDVQATTTGAETVDLPVPMVHKVTNPLGTTVILRPLGGGTPTAATPTMVMPVNTRITTTRCMAPQGVLTNHDEGEVVDGPHLGVRGFFFNPDLALEKLGTR